MEMNCKEKLRDERSYWKVAVSLGFSLVGTCLFLYFGYKLLGFFMPFVIGWCIASIASPVVNWLEKRLKIIKKWGSALIIIGVLGAVGLLIYLLVSTLSREIAGLIQNMPDMYEDLEAGDGRRQFERHLQASARRSQGRMAYDDGEPGEYGG